MTYEAHVTISIQVRAKLNIILIPIAHFPRPLSNVSTPLTRRTPSPIFIFFVCESIHKVRYKLIPYHTTVYEINHRASTIF